MRKFLWAALKTLLVLIILAGALVGLWFLGERLGWPKWEGPAILAGVLGLIIGVKAVKRWLFRRREESFVRRIIDQDNAAIAGAPLQERPQLLELQERWKHAVGILRNSRIRKRGNPIYALPWYLVLGESGSGKTTAIQSARLVSPLTDVGPARGIAGTRNCDWWFCEEAVLLDTAGRYAIPVDEGRDKEEWTKFLSLLVKYRKRAPLDGVVVTIPVDSLNRSDDALVEDGRNLRRRIDEIMRAMGANFPVWILVTKMDLIHGMTNLAERLPERALDEPMGQAVEPGPHDAAETAGKILDNVVERLRDLRTRIVLATETGDPGLMAFPGEVEALRPRLMSIITTIFEPNPYQELPLLRGVYFSSARQEGTATSRRLQSLDALKDLKTILPGTDKGFFLKRFFGRVLPMDRGLFTPIISFIRWRRLTTSLGLLAWLALLGCLAGLATVSFMKNKAALDEFTQEFARAPQMTGNLDTDLTMLDKYRRSLAQLSQGNQNWWTPRMGFDQSEAMERQLLDNYCDMVNRDIFGKLTQDANAKLTRFAQRSPDSDIGQFIDHVERRINLLQATLNGAKPAKLQAMPQPSYDFQVLAEQKMTPGTAALLPQVVLDWLAWNGDKASVERSLEESRSLLLSMALQRNANLHWLANWANGLPDLKPVTMDQFWGEAVLYDKDPVQVDPAYTAKGKERIDAFLAQIRASMGGSAALQAKEDEFRAWYEEQCVKSWEKFAAKFPDARYKIAGQNARRETAATMSAWNNPYLGLLDTMAVELDFLKDRKANPAWLAQTFRLREVMLQAKNQELQDATASLVKAAQEGEKLVSKVMGKDKESAKDAKDKEAAKPEAQRRLEENLAAAKDVKEYSAALAQLLPATGSSAVAYKLAAEFYPYSLAPSESKSPIFAAGNALSRLKNTLGRRVAGDRLFWEILSGPLNHLLDYITMEASCEIQSRWESEVLSQIQAMPDAKLRKALFDESQGLVWKFAKGTAAPFLGQNMRGYFPKTAMGQSMPFSPAFMALLNQGSVREQQVLPSYQVQFDARPTDVNAQAKARPYATVLTVQCAKDLQRLENYNYPAGMKIDWSPDTCGDVSLEIQFDSFKLDKMYPGPQGLQSFLADFRTGAKRFTQSDFPDHAGDLAGLGVSAITVGYNIRGAEPVLGLFKVEQQVKVPDTIIPCWHY